MEAGAATRSRPFSASPLWTILTGKHPGQFSTVPKAIKRGLEFVDPLYFDNGKGNYLGCLMHGGVWDTILAAQALAQAGETSEPLVLHRRAAL